MTETDVHRLFLIYFFEEIFFKWLYSSLDIVVSRELITACNLHLAG